MSPGLTLAENADIFWKVAFGRRLLYLGSTFSVLAYKHPEESYEESYGMGRGGSRSFISWQGVLWNLK